MKRLPLAAGDKDQLVTIERRATGQDGRGQVSGAWQTHLTNLWASVRPLRGREWLAAGQEQATAEMVVGLDFRTDIVRTDRVVWNGKPFDIVGEPIDVDGQHHTLELMCVNGVRGAR